MVTAAKKEAVYAEFGKRLGRLCDQRQIPDRGRAQALGKLVGVGYKGAEKWLKGLSMPDQANAVSLATVLHVPYEFLMTGRGPETLPGNDTDEVAEQVADYNLGAIVQMVDKALDEANLPADHRLRKHPEYGQLIELIADWYNNKKGIDKTQLADLLRLAVLKEK